MSILDRILSDVDSTRAIAESNAAKLDQILAILNEDPITGASITLTEGAKMLAKKASKAAAIGDFQLLDNGTATATISFVDSVGEPTAPVAGATVATNVTSSDPGIVVALDSTGLIITVSPASPLPTPLPTGVTITAVPTISNPDGSTLGPFTAVSQPIDLVAGGPAGASIALS
jgi:hypothetical protein